MTPDILFILHLPPPVHGAAMVGEYIKNSEVINSAVNGHYINLATASSLKDIGKGGLKKAWRFARLLSHIRREVKCVKPALVYITPNSCGGPFYKDFIVVQMLKAMGCRIVAHYHNKGVSTHQQRRFDDLLYRRFFKGLKVILLSELLYDDVKRYVAREDVTICPNGIPDIAPAAAVERAEDEPAKLLFLSNLLISKGVLVLLDALKLLKERGCHVVCDFVGAESAELDAAAFSREAESRGISDIATYRGKQYGADKERYFAEADVFVFPTFYPNECFPLVLLEAMQHGLPCVSTREGAIPEIVKEGETGLLCDRQDAQSLADSLQRLISDQGERRRMGAAARLRYQSRFTLPIFEERMREIIARETRL